MSSDNNFASKCVSKRTPRIICKYSAAVLPLIALLVAGYYLLSNNEADDAAPAGPVGATENARVAAASSCRSCGSGCGHSKSAVRKKIPAKPVTVDGMDTWRTAKLGQQKAVQVGGLKIEGKVTISEQNKYGKQVYALGLENGGYFYMIEASPDQFKGNVVIKNKAGEMTAYEFTGSGNNWKMRELPFKEFLCSSGNTSEKVGMPSDEAPFTPPGQAAIVPLLNSLPSAQATLYLDFDGELVTGTRWNASLGGDPIDAEESGLSEVQIRAIWEEAAEDMRPFNINVTTDRSRFDNTPVNRRMQVIITPTTDAAPFAGGVAYLDSFFDGTIDPCWVFNLGPGSAGLTVSHEAGHTFGLRHDGLDGQEYHPGNGTWGPIMGAPFDQDGSWSEGNYTGSTNTEDDLEMIADLGTNGFGYREDDYGDSNGTGFDLSNNVGSDAVEVLGVISEIDDVDVFSFTTSGGESTLTATPTSPFPNLNVRARLFDSSANLVAEDDPANSFSASVTANLEPGVYHFHVEGVANGSPDISGFNDYSSLGAFGVTGNVAGLGGLIVDIIEPELSEVSILDGNGLIVNASVVGNADSVIWSSIRSPLGGIATFQPNNALASRVTFSQPGLYTLQFKATKDGVDSTETLQVSVEAAGDVQLFANKGPAITLNSPEEFYSREGLLNGRAQDDGVPVETTPALEWVVVSGNAVIENPLAVSPIIRFADSAPNEVALESSDGQIRTFKQITVQSVYEAREVVGGTKPVKWFIPRDDTLALTWTALAFVDTLWNDGTLGVGFNTNDDYNQFLNGGTDIKSEMKRKSPSAYLRMHFDLPPLDYVPGMKLRINYNDGFVLYLNGTEVTRKNAPLGVLSWDSTALLTRDLADVLVADEIDLAPYTGLLVPGKNVISIHGLNNSKSNGRFLIYPTLTADIVASPFLIFMETHGIDLLPYLDADGDGVLNFVEHALGTDPRVPDASSPITVLPDGSVSITLPENAPQDVDYIVEKSVNMTDWTPVATKRGQGDWQGESILFSVTETTGGKITYNLRQLTALPASFYRIVYTLRGPSVAP